MKFTVWDVEYNPTTRSRNAEPASLITGLLGTYRRPHPNFRVAIHELTRGDWV